MKKLLAAVAILATAACSRLPTVEDVATATTQATEAIGEQGEAAVVGTSEMEMTDTLLNGFSSASSLSRLSPVELTPRRLIEAMDPRRLEMVAAPLRSAKLADRQLQSVEGEDAGAGFRQAMQDLGVYLRTRIFIEENVEERVGDHVIFRIEGDDVCTAGDTTCIDAFNQFEVRLSATRGDNSIDVTLLLGPERHAPFRVQVSESFMSVSVELNELRDSYIYASSVTGQELYGLPEVMEGELELRAERHGERDYSISFNVLQAVRVELTDDSAGGLYTYGTAAKSPLATLRYDDVNKRVSGGLDVGVTEYGYPYSPVVSSSGNAGERILQRLGGASYSFDYTDGDTELVITNIGLGDVQTVEVLDTTTLMAVDLNADSGRRYDMTISPNAAGRAVVTVNPGIDLSVLNFREPLTVDSDVYVAPYELDETLRYQFNGTTPTVEDVPADEVSGFPGGVKVVSGTITLSTTAPDVAPVVVEAGSCLTSATPADGSHEILGSYAVVACP